MRALITGGAGFVGRHLTNQLVEAGWHVMIVDPIIAGGGGRLPDKQDRVIFHREDCREFFRWHKLAEFDAVFHLAAVIGGRESIDNNPLAVADDLSIDAAMFQWASDSIGPHVVYFSSSAAYPVALQTAAAYRPLTEHDIDLDDVRSPDATYGWSKLTGEILARQAMEKYGIPVTIYRPFSGYGPDQDLAYPVPSICRREARRQPGEPATVWGAGTQLRDFVHIDDICRAVLRTWHVSGLTLNLSSGVGTSFVDVARLAAGDPDLEVLNDIDKPAGVFGRVGAAGRQAAHGIRHTVPLLDGLAGCVDYWTARLTLERGVVSVEDMRAAHGL